MSETIIVALIGLAGTLAGSYFSGRRNSKELLAKLETAQAVTDTKIDSLTREVRVHNSFASRIPAIETKVEYFEKIAERMTNHEN